MRVQADPQANVSSDSQSISPFIHEADAAIASVTLPSALQLVPRMVGAADRQTAHCKHLMVVDSDGTAREALAAFLRRRGYRVWGAANAIEAQSMITYKLPNLMLLDTTLSGVSGVDLIRQLRRRRRTTLLPIIIISELTTPRDIRNGLAIGADDYINKPLELSVVEARINALLRRDERMRQELSPLAHIELPAMDQATELN